MKVFKKILYFIFSVLIMGLSFNTYALDQMAKEEKTPPPAEGALTTDQIPPIYNMETTTAKG